MESSLRVNALIFLIKSAQAANDFIIRLTIVKPFGQFRIRVTWSLQEELYLGFSFSY